MKRIVLNHWSSQTSISTRATLVTINNKLVLAEAVLIGLAIILWLYHIIREWIYIFRYAVNILVWSLTGGFTHLFLSPKKTSLTIKANF